MRKETKKKSWIHGPLPIVNTEHEHSRHMNSQKQLACHLLELLYNGVSFLFTQNSALLCFWPAKEYFEWIWLCKGSTYNWERQNVAICSLYLALTVACGSCLPSWFAFLPPSPPASYHQFLILPSSHTCVSTLFPSYSHMSACPHLISSLFLQSKVHSCLLDSILQAYFQCCAKWLFSSQLLLNICNRKKKGNQKGNTNLHLLICDSISSLVQVQKQLRFCLMQSLEK